MCSLYVVVRDDIYGAEEICYTHVFSEAWSAAAAEISAADRKMTVYVNRFDLEPGWKEKFSGLSPEEIYWNDDFDNCVADEIFSVERCIPVLA